MQSKTALGRVFWSTLGNRNSIVTFSKSNLAIEFLLKLLQRFHRFVSKKKFVERHLFRRMEKLKNPFRIVNYLFMKKYTSNKLNINK